MADILYDVAGGAKKRLLDMGDDTHAEIVALGGFSGNVVVEGDANLDTAGIGDPEDAAWSGSDASASLVAIMKAIYAQNEAIIALLTDIETNTGE